MPLKLFLYFKRTFLVVIAFLLVSGCDTTKPAEITSLLVNAEERREFSLLKMSDSIAVLPLELPDSVFFGEVNRIKVYGDKFFLHDAYQTKTITVVNSEGIYINQLNKKGDGPGEYEDLESFAFNPRTNELVINQRNENLIFYTFPGLEKIRQTNNHTPYMNIDLIEPNFWFAASDDVVDEGNYVGAVKLNYAFEEFSRLDIPLQPVSVEASNSSTVTVRDGNIIYATPSFESIVYLIDSVNTKPILKVDFGNNRISEDTWKTLDPEVFHNELINNKRAAGVHNFVLSGDRGSFWYYFGGIETRHLAIFDLSSKATKVFSKITMEGLKMQNPYPVGIYKDFYMIVLYPDQLRIDEQTTGAPAYLRKIMEYKKANKVMLLLFKPKLDI